jgi:hypothetical protein
VPWEFLKCPIKEKHFNAPKFARRSANAEPTLSGLKARAKCLTRNSQLHESKSFSTDDIFLSPFSAQKSQCQAQKRYKQFKINQIDLAF